MQSGDILLFKGEKGLSRLIQWGTNSIYSHVAICVSSEMNLAIESFPGKGVRARDIRIIKNNYDVFRVKKPFDLDKTISFLVSKLNQKYDTWGVVYLGILKLVGKVFKRAKDSANKWQKDRDYFCSELVYEAFLFGGLDIVPEVSDADITSPGDIAKSDVVTLMK